MTHAARAGITWGQLPYNGRPPDEDEEDEEEEDEEEEDEEEAVSYTHLTLPTICSV